MNRDKFKSLLKDNNQAKTKAELENDPFLSDALEGYGTLDIQDLKKLDKRFYKNRGILNFSLVILFVSTFAIGGLIFKKDTSKRSSIIDKNTSLTQSKPNSNLVKIKNDTIISDGAMGEIITTKTIKNKSDEKISGTAPITDKAATASRGPEDHSW